MRELSSYILHWEERVRVYEQRSKEPLGERVKASVLTIITCGHRPLKDHFDLNSSRLRTYTHIREEITLYIEGTAPPWTRADGRGRRRPQGRLLAAPRRRKGTRRRLLQLRLAALRQIVPHRRR